MHAEKTIRYLLVSSNLGLLMLSISCCRPGRCIIGVMQLPSAHELSGVTEYSKSTSSLVDNSPG